MRLLLVFTLIAATSCYKFLVYSPIFGYSHTRLMGAIGDTLFKGGHNVTMLMPVIDVKERHKLGFKLVKDVRFVEMNEAVHTMMEESQKNIYKMFWTISPDPISLLQHGQNFTKMFTMATEILFDEKDLLAKLKAENYDAGIAEPFDASGFMLFDHLGINRTMAAISQTRLEPFSKAIGEPGAPSYVPTLMSPNGEKMALYQRVGNLFGSYMSGMFFENIYMTEYNAMKKKFPEMRHIYDMFGSASIVFTNGNPFLNYPHPVLHKSVEVGGITAEWENKKGDLDGILDKILSDRKHTVYISFGSVAKSKDMPDSWKNSFIEVFTKMQDVTFIWKYEEKSAIVDHLPNVHLLQWAPQNQILADKRLSVFITHGGLGSTTELAHSGKPAIMIPLFAEQPRNAAMLSRHGGALVLKKDELINPEITIAAIKKVIHDKSYSVNADKLAQMLRNRPISNEELVLKHAEFVAKYGPLTQLDAHGRHLSLIQYYFIDAALLVLSILFIILFVIIRVFKCFYRKCCSSSKAKKD